MLVNEVILKHMPEVGFGLIMGDIRSGKSVMGYGLLEDLGFKSGRAMCVFGLPKEKTALLPNHIKHVYHVEEMVEGSITLFDESYKEFYAREWQQDPNKMIDTLAGLAGQKDMLSIFITHQSRKLDVGVVAALQFLIYKKPSMLQYRFERPQLRSLSKEAHVAFQKYTKKEARKHAYVFFPDYQGMILNSNQVPKWWTEEISKAYANVSITEEKQPADIVSKFLCLECDKTAIGLCSKCKCSVCEEHAKTKHSHGTVIPFSQNAVLAKF